MEQFFKILKVTPTASLDEIKRAYKTQVKFWHPDRFPVESERLQKLANRRMRDINRAYRELEQHLARETSPPADPSLSPVGQEHGPTLQFQNGDCYIGPLAGSVPHGYGTYLFAEGNQYTGEFVSGKPHGLGTLVFTNGDKYEGDFVQDVMEGEGIYTSANRDRFVGGFKNGQPHGRGVHITAAGKQYPGLWQDGTLIEQD